MKQMTKMPSGEEEFSDSQWLLGYCYDLKC